MGRLGCNETARDKLVWDCFSAARRMLDLDCSSSLSADMDEIDCNREGIWISAIEGTHMGTFPAFFFLVGMAVEVRGIREEGWVDINDGVWELGTDD